MAISLIISALLVSSETVYPLSTLNPEDVLRIPVTKTTYQRLEEIMTQRYEEHERAIDEPIKKFSKQDRIVSIEDQRYTKLKEEFIETIILSGAKEALDRLKWILESTGGAIQLIFIEDEKELPVFNGKKIWGHPGKYITVFAIKGEDMTEEGRRKIIARLFHEIRARSTALTYMVKTKNPSSIEELDIMLGEFEKTNKQIEQDIQRYGMIKDEILRLEFANLAFTKEVPKIRDYAMSRNAFLKFLAIATALPWVFIGDNKPPIPIVEPLMDTSKRSEKTSEQLISEQVQEIISKMTLKEKLGFLIMVSMDPSFSQQDIDYISNYYKFRVYLYDTFYPVDYDGAVISRIFEAQAKFYSQGLLPLIAINMEGGWISLIPDAPFPSPMAIGATGSHELAEVNGRMIGQTLAKLGINVNLAPVLDLHTNPENKIISTRSFGSNPEKVAAQGTAFIKGLQSEGVLAVAKHFPGIGGATGDPHIVIPRLDKNLAQLEGQELIPFIEAINAGVKIIMTGHLLVPQIDPKNPASLSKIFTTDILRQRLGFKGVVMVDDVRMMAITSKSKGMGLSVQEATIRAIEAGADIVLGPRKEVYKGLRRGLQSGRITEKRVNESVARIVGLQLRQSRANFAAIKPNDIFNDAEMQHNVEVIAENAVTVIKNSPRILPIRINTYDKLLVIHPELINDVGEHRIRLYEYVKIKHENTDFMPMDVNPTNEQRTSIINAIYNYSHVIFALYDHVYGSDEASIIKQIEILKGILAKNSNVIVILLKDPSCYYRLPEETPAVLATYDKKPALLQAAVNIIFGKIKSEGSLPIEIKLDEVATKEKIESVKTHQSNI